MNDALDIKRVFGPILKRIWWVIAFAIYGGIKGANEADSMNPVYETRATIKLNDQYTALTKFLEEIESFSTIGKYVQELTVMRSEYILEKAIERMDLDYSLYYFEGNNWRPLYKKEPFRINFQLMDSSLVDLPLELDFFSEDSIILHIRETASQPFPLNQTTKHSGLEMKLQPGAHPIIAGKYLIIFPSMAALKEDLGNADDLLIRLQDEKVAIVNFYTWDESPQRAADFANALANAYLDDFRQSKVLAAGQALNFMDERLSHATQKLIRAERELASFQARYQVWKFSGRMQDQLERLGEIEKRRIQVRFEEVNLENLTKVFAQDSFKKGEILNYESIRDAQWKDGIEQIEQKLSFRSHLLKKLQANHPVVLRLNREISLLKKQMRLSIERTKLANLRTQSTLNLREQEIQKQIATLPAIEQRLWELHRKVKIAEMVQGDLLEKRAEAAIGAVSDDTYHQLLEPALVPIKHMRPFRHIKIVIGALMQAVYCCFYIHFWLLLRGLLTRKSDLEVHLQGELVGYIPGLSAKATYLSQHFVNLAMHFHLQGKEMQMISLGADQNREGKTETILQLSQAFGMLGEKVLLVDLDLFDPQLGPKLGLRNSVGIVEMVLRIWNAEATILASGFENVSIITTGQTRKLLPARVLTHAHLWSELNRLKSNFDRILILLPSFCRGADGFAIMHQCEATLMVCRGGISRIRRLKRNERRIIHVQAQNYGLIYIDHLVKEGIHYEVGFDETKRLNKGGMLQALKRLVFQVFFNRNPFNDGLGLPKVGLGTRRKIIWRWIKNRIFRK